MFSRLVLLAIYAFCVLQVQLAKAQVTVGFDEPHNVVILSVPDKTAALQIDVLHLKVEQNQFDQSVTRRRLQASDGHGWMLTAFVHPLEKSATAAELNEHEFRGLREAAAENKFKLEQMKTFQHGEFSMRQYLIPEFRGQRVNQMNVFGYATSGGMALDFHISKSPYSAGDEQFLDSLLKGIHLVQPYKPDSTTEFEYGSVFYLRSEWRRAVAHYEKSLELEKQKRTLTPVLWNVLVDNLGMAYAFSGQMPKAKSLFEYGVQQNPTYPMFHYNIACADAELGDIDGALEQLKLAFQYKSYSNPGEGVPDPTKDDSFKRYLNNPKFTQLANEVCPRSRKTGVGWVCQ